MTKYFAEPNKSQKEQEDVGAKLHIDARRPPVTPREKKSLRKKSARYFLQIFIFASQKEAGPSQDMKNPYSVIMELILKLRWSIILCEQ